MKSLPLIAVLLALTACNSGRDKQAIRNCFSNYKTAIAKQDGAAAAALLSKNSIGYYGSILNLALTGEESKIRQQHFYRKMMVLFVRHEAGDSLRTSNMSAPDFFAFIVNRGLEGEMVSRSVELGEISVKGNLAVAQGVLNGQLTPATLVFEREATGWKLSLLDAILRMDELTAEKLKNSSLSEDDAIIQALQKRSSRPVSNDVWQPLGQKQRST